VFRIASTCAPACVRRGVLGRMGSPATTRCQRATLDVRRRVPYDPDRNLDVSEVTRGICGS